MLFAGHFDQLATAVAPVLLLGGLGFALARTGRLKGVQQLAPLVTDVASPFLVFGVFARLRIDPHALMTMAAGCIICLAAFAAVSSIVLWLSGLRVTVYLGALSFPNTGNLGLPVAAAAFGPAGLGLATVFYAISSLANAIVGQALAARTFDWRVVARMPLVYAGVLGTALSVARIELPPYASAAVTLAGQMAVPLMLIMLGGALAQLGIRSAQRALALSAVRLGMGVAVGWLVASLLDLHDVARATLVLQSAMPAAVNSYVFAERWNAEPAEIAGLVVTSNGVACASIPLLLAMLGG